MVAAPPPPPPVFAPSLPADADLDIAADDLLAVVIYVLVASIAVIVAFVVIYAATRWRGLQMGKLALKGSRKVRQVAEQVAEQAARIE